jgi:hypothetical protein
MPLSLLADASAPALLLLRKHNHIISVAISSPTSSTPTTACCTFYPTAPRTATVVEIFSASPSDADAWLGPSTLYVQYWQHRCVRSSSTRCWVWQTQPHLGSGGLTALTSASTLPFPPRLPQLRCCLSSMSTTALTASTSALPPPMTTASTRLRHHPGASCAPAAPSTRQPNHNYVDLGYL